jgi:hypothetical protein
MFFPGSRYQKTGTYVVTGPDGRPVTVARVPLPPRDEDIRLAGWHRRLEGQRLDLIANHHLADPTTFWRLCDANSSVVPDALAARGLIGIPRAGS